MCDFTIQTEFLFSFKLRDQILWGSANIMVKYF